MTIIAVIWILWVIIFSITGYLYLTSTTIKVPKLPKVKGEKREKTPAEELAASRKLWMAAEKKMMEGWETACNCPQWNVPYCEGEGKGKDYRCRAVIPEYVSEPAYRMGGMEYIRQGQTTKVKLSGTGEELLAINQMFRRAQDAAYLSPDTSAAERHLHDLHRQAEYWQAKLQTEDARLRESLPRRQPNGSGTNRSQLIADQVSGTYPASESIPIPPDGRVDLHQYSPFRQGEYPA